LRPILLYLTFFVLTSCSQLSFDDVDNSLVEENPSVRVFTSDEIQDEIEIFSDKMAKKKMKPLNAKFILGGLKALSKNEFVQANDNFQRALKYEPLNSHLHMLNGLTHQMRGEFGDPQQYKMAEVGYDLAAKLDPGDSRVPYFAGVLNFKQQKYHQAQNHFVRAVALDSENSDYFLGLAAASYYLGELDRAYLSIERALELSPSRTAIQQSAGVIFASMGDFDKAKNLSLSLADNHSMRGQYLDQRILEWEKYYSRNNINSDKEFKELLAQNLDIFGVPKGGMFDSTGSTTVDPMNKRLGSGSGASSAPVTSAPLQAPSATTVAPLAAKAVAPAKVTAKPKIVIPKMALIDVAIIRTEEIYTTSKGVNLLNGLNIFFTGDQFYQQRTPFGKVRTALAGNDTMTLKLGTAGAGLTYSLNIFSNNYDRNEIIARPSILVEDRKKSSFFSGGTMHVVIEGGVAGSGAMQPLNTGVKLEVTPQFLDSNTINLNVFAQRVFLETSLSQVSDNITGTSFATSSKTTISANLTLRYGETMILSGLSDQEKEIVDDKVPVLGDVPITQYLFRNQRKTSSKKTVLVLLTPRAANLSYENGDPKNERGEIHNTPISKLEKQAKWMQPAPHLTAFVKHLGKYEFFNHYRTGDMQLENWAGEGTVTDAIKRTLEYFYIFYGFDKSDESAL